MKWIAAAGLLGVAVGLVATRPLVRVHAATEVTWRGQVAPLLYKKLHRLPSRGGLGAVSLMAYGDAKAVLLR